MDDLFSVDEEVVTTDENIDYYEQLVGEGKKFKSERDLARGKWESDQYIAKLKQKLEETENELKSRAAMEELYNKLKSGDTNNRQDELPVTPDRQGVNEDELEAKVAALLEKREKARSLETNMGRVTRVLEETFGNSNSANAALNKIARETGMSMGDIRDLAQRSPDAVFRLMGITEGPRNPTTPVAPKGSVVAGLGPSGTVRNSAYYERMKQTDPKKYFADSTTVQMMNDRRALGDKFYQ